MGMILALFCFLVWTVWLTGSQLSAQASAMQQIIEFQITKISAFATDRGFTATPADLKTLGTQILGSFGKVTAAVSSVVGTFTSLVMMLVLAIFIALEPRIYERRSEEHTSELPSLMRNSYDVFCLTQKHTSSHKPS